MCRAQLAARKWPTSGKDDLEALIANDTDLGTRELGRLHGVTNRLIGSVWRSNDMKQQISLLRAFGSNGMLKLVP